MSHIRRRRYQCCGRTAIHPRLLLLLLLASLPCVTQAWGSSNSDSDYTIFGNKFARSWLYDGSSISLKVEGCVWGYVEDEEEAGCIEASSEDGTYSWYQMANCRRAQVAYSLYTDNGSCSSGNYQETFVTTNGLAEFIYYSQSYDSNTPFPQNDGGDDDGYGGYSLDELPECEGEENGYLGISCGDDGSFVLESFGDQYCLERGSTYNSMNKLNKAMKTYKNCASVFSSGDSSDSSFVHKLVYYSESCSSLDSSICKDDNSFKLRKASAGRHKAWNSNGSQGYKSWMTKLKYATGGLLLLASFVMFTGILFTNRRRRRALLQRKYRQKARSGASSSGRKKRSKSRDDRTNGGRSRKSSKSGKSKRSRSRKKSKESEAAADSGGVFT